MAPRRRAVRRLSALVAAVCAAVLAAPPALADFPYPSGTGGDYRSLKTAPGQTPNDLDGDNNRFKYAATPDPDNHVNNNRPTDLHGHRGKRVVHSNPNGDTA